MCSIVTIVVYTQGGDGVDVGEMDGSENHDLETSVPLAHVPFVTRLVIFVCAVLSEVRVGCRV